MLFCDSHYYRPHIRGSGDAGNSIGVIDIINERCDWGRSADRLGTIAVLLDQAEPIGPPYFSVYSRNRSMGKARKFRHA